MNKVIQRSMQSYFVVYFSIAAGQFILFSLMRNIEVIFFIMSGLWIILLVFIAEKVSHQRAFMVFLLIGIFLKFIWIVFVPSPAVSDYAIMYNSAKEMLTGSREYLHNIYYLRFPYQMGFTAYQSIVLRVMDSVTGLKLINAMWCAVASAAVYGIAREAFDRDVARLALLLHITLLPLLMLSSVLTNQHIAVAWIYVGLYVWLKYSRNTWWAPIVAGLALAVGTVMRPIGIVVVAAIVINEMIQLLQQKSKSHLMGSIRRIVSTVFAYQLVLLVAGAMLTQTGISPDGLKNNDPLWKLVAGFNADSNGAYSTADENRLNFGYMKADQRNALEKQIIQQRLTNPVNMIKLPFLKIGKLWADYQPTWLTFPYKQGTYLSYLGWTVSFDEVLERYRPFERAVSYILTLLAFWGVLTSIRLEFLNDKRRLLILILGAYTLVLLIVEVQSRYLYFLFVILVVFGAAELLKIRNYIARRLS